MSSILEALKKAERESAADRGTGTPWPAPLSEPAPYRPRRHRRWMIFSLVGIGCVCALLFWQIRRPHAPGKTAPATTQLPESPARSSKPTAVAARQAATTRRPPVESQSPPPAATPATAVPRKTRPVVQASPPASTAKIVQPAMTQPSVIPQAKAPSVQPPAAPQPDRRIDVATPAGKTSTRPDPVVEAADRSPSVEEADKNFRSDPRIELQALVWSQDAGARFVVINNRLIKEGGSLDNIVVVQINRDDVLLSEGSDRWHEKFKIR